MDSSQRNAGTPEPGPRPAPGARRRVDPVVAGGWAVAAALLGLFLAVRFLRPWFVDYEAEWSAVQATAWLENGIPPFPLFRIRNTTLYIGQLHLFLEALPLWLDRDPGSAIAFLNLLNAGAAALLFALVWRTHGLAVALGALFLLAFQVQSVARSTSPHARCFSVPYTIVLMVALQRVMVLGQHRWLPAAAGALALVTQTYGFATVLLFPGVAGLALLYRPRVPARTWLAAAAVFAVLQVPGLVAEAAHGWPTFGPLLRGQVRMDNPHDDPGGRGPTADGVPAVLAGQAEMLLGEGPVEQRPRWDLALALGVAATAFLAWREARRARSWRRSPSAFLLLWSAGFVVAPLAVGAGNRTYLGQFLAPVMMAVGLVAPLAWLAARPGAAARWAGRGSLAALAAWAVTAAVDGAAARPARALSEPAPEEGQPSLEDTRAVMGDLVARGLGRPAFQKRVHGWPLLGDHAADKLLFRVQCRAGAGAPCDDDDPGLGDRHFLVSAPGFPLQPADPVRVVDAGGLRLHEYRSRLRLPLQARAFPAGESPGEGDTLVLPGPGRGQPAFPGRRATMAGWLATTFLHESSYAPEAARFGPTPAPGDLLAWGTLAVDAPLPAGQSLHLVLDLADEAPDCVATLFLDGRRLGPEDVRRREARVMPQQVVQLDADVTARATPGDHVVALRLRQCVARRFDFYDLAVAP